MELNELIVLLAGIAAAIVGTALVYVITLWAGAKGAQYWRIIKGQIPAAIKAVDEPGDKIPATIDQYLDKLVAAKWDEMFAAFAPTFLEKIDKLVSDKLGVES